MDFTLRRTNWREDGIFGEFKSADNSFFAITLEHSYNNVPKLAQGSYACIRHAPNRLPYETFMVMKVPDFQAEPVNGILIHILNFNEESEGCIGVGEQRGFKSNGSWMLMNSKKAFDDFMKIQEGYEQFILNVIN